MWRDEVLLLDMLLAASDAREFTSGLDWAAFVESKLHQSAVIRCLEIIGEAAGKISKDFRVAHPEIPWREIVGMRRRLAHGYAEVKLDVVWDVAWNRLPQLCQALRPLIPPDDPSR